MDPISSTAEDTTPEPWDPKFTAQLSGDPVATHFFILGYEPVPESLSYAGGRADVFLLEPVTAAAVEYEDGWILLDSGFNVEIVRSPELRRQYFNFESYTAIIPPGDPLLDGIAEAGLKWDKLRLCAISHTHLDHTGGLRLVPSGVPIALQHREWDYVVSLDGISGAVFPHEILDANRLIVLLDGDTKLAPGLTAWDTRGHTPGHQSFEIRMQKKSIVLAFDAADLERNLTDSVRCGWTIGTDGVHDAEAAIQRLVEATRMGSDVWPGHDPGWWERRLAGKRYLRIPELAE